MSAVFYHDDAQREAIARTRQQFVDAPEQVQTEIAPLDRFWIAEDYHQKYRLRNADALAGELMALYPDAKEFVASTAAARINAYLAGHGSTAQFEREIGQLGLTAAGQELLRASR